MLLYTQKGDIFRFEDIKRIYVSVYNEICCDTFNCGKGWVIGRYKTKERCKEITTEITVKYNDLKRYELRTKSGNYNYNTYESFVYYMPEE